MSARWPRCGYSSPAIRWCRSARSATRPASAPSRYRRNASCCGEDAAHTHWNVPLQIRVGVDAAPHTVLLTEDGQTVAAGRCDQPLSVNATRVGFFRVAYDAATLANNTRAFAQLPRGDRIALLDDQWALSEIDPDQLPAYLALASAMGDTLNQRAWEQITDALDTIETFERNTPGHTAFAATARAVVKPIADRLGWDGKADETPASNAC